MTLTFKNDPEIIRHCLEFYEEYIEALSEAIGADHFTSMVFFQPIPSYVGHFGQERGGNMLGLEDMKDNAVLLTAGASLDAAGAAVAVAQALLFEMSNKITDYTDSVNGSVDFVYLNYAEASQNPLGSYGDDKVEFIREVAAKYDPAGVFQTRIPGGFKINKVD